MSASAAKNAATNVSKGPGAEHGDVSATSVRAWHTLAADEVLQLLGSHWDGLTSSEAETRLARYGPNQLPEAKRRTIAAMIADQFKDFMILLLIGAAVVSGLIGEPQDTIAILVIVVLNAVIGFVQEVRAERAMEALRKLAAPNAVVRRKGQTVEIPAEHLVPGDMVLLDAGRIVPADLRLLESASLRIAEAVLTGESVPVEKTVDAIPDHDAALGDRRNMAYKGTQVVYGRGVGVVAATGVSTELGRIANLLGAAEEVKTPLQKRLAVFGRNLGLAALAICALVFGIGVMRGEEVVLMFLTAVSLAVAAVPEALPAVVTITLALGARRMVQSNALIRRLPAVEALGSVTYICTDKTGTLTQNKMKAERFSVHGSVVSGIPAVYIEPWTWLLRGAALCNDVSKAGEREEQNVVGDPTEIALYEVAAEAGFRRELLEEDWPRIEEIPFDSERKCMTTVHTSPEGGWVSFTKGAAEVIVDRSLDVLGKDGTLPLDAEQIGREIEAMAADGLRVLAIAMHRWKEIPSSTVPEDVEKDLTFIGLIGLMDPPRPEAQEAVRLCTSAGIRPVMITGDHPVTAQAIARRLGIADGCDPVLTGKELEALPLDEFEKIVREVRVYARVAPEQKVKIVRALQDQGEFVAMTGDGVNDAPALKRAEIGVAMGITGTDVAKQASHMILLDDNFATIVRAVREGRRIYDNIRKFVKYTMTSNSGEIWTIFLAPFLGLPIPLLPIHILWINLVTDGLPGLAFSAEPEEKGLMKRPPRHPQESMFAQGLGAQIVWVGLLMGAVSLATQGWAFYTGNAHWQTMVFTVLCLSQMGNALAIRSDRESLFRQGLWSNLPMAGAVMLTLGLQLATIYVPFLQPVFKTAPLSMSELWACLGLSTSVFWAVEAAKWLNRRREDRTRRSAPGSTSGIHVAPQN